MQLPPTQQAPLVPEQSDFPQHGPPLVPQATIWPLLHTMPLLLLSPDARHVLPPTQQPPPWQEPPGQHASPAVPQTAHWPPLHVPPFLHIAPSLRHCCETGSQQAPLALHVLPAQHGSPAPPHALHVPPLHARPAPVQASPAQHG
jgi:hypothetical protein